MAPRIEQLLATLHARGEFDGALVVSDRRGVLYAGAVGLAVAETGTAHTVATAVDGASLAKTFTAALVLGLVAEQRLGLDHPVQRYVAEVPYALTVRQLLAHSTGLPDYGWYDAHLAADEVRTTPRMMQVLAAQHYTPPFMPGTRFEYSSPGYDLAALVVERVTGKTYEALLAERFFGPLGMRDSFVRPARLADFTGVRTRGYRRTETGIQPFDALDLEGFYGGSNIYLSARDLDRWNRLWIDRPPAILDDHSSPLSLRSLYASGTATWYLGYHQGFRSVMWRDLASGLSIVFVTNHATPPHVLTGLVPAILAVQRRRDPMPAVAAWDVLDKEPPLVGSWDVDGVGTIAITRADTRWSLRSPAGVEYPMFRVEETAFYVPGLDAWIGLHEALVRWRTTNDRARGKRRVLPDLAR